MAGGPDRIAADGGYWVDERGSSRFVRISGVVDLVDRGALSELLLAPQELLLATSVRVGQPAVRRAAARLFGRRLSFGSASRCSWSLAKAEHTELSLP